MAGTSRIGRRTFLRAPVEAGLAGIAGVTVVTPGPAENEVLVGVSKTAGSPRVVIEAHVPGDERVVHQTRHSATLLSNPHRGTQPSVRERHLGERTTHVAGIAAGTTDDAEGTGGSSNSSLLSGRALSEDGRGSTNYT